MRRHLAFILVLCVLADQASASCGAAFCTTNTAWNVQAPWSEAGTRLDVRGEYINQDQPRRGRRNVDVGEVPSHHDEISTLNRNVVVNLDHSFDVNWGVGVTVPIVDRDHQHFHHHDGEVIREAWDFRRLGDARVVGHYQLPLEGPSGGVGALFGVKLPTGPFELHNKNGDEAERTLQPGTGTTDLLFGGFVHGPLPWSASSFFAQAMVQAPMDDRDDFRPGTRFNLDLGYSYEATEWLSLLVQMNILHQRPDTGREAEHEDSGGTIVSLSPGVSLAVNDRARLYAFVQVPIYEYMNGVQLSADWGAIAGTSIRF